MRLPTASRTPLCFLFASETFLTNLIQRRRSSLYLAFEVTLVVKFGAEFMLRLISDKEEPWDGPINLRFLDCVIAEVVNMKVSSEANRAIYLGID